MRQGRIRQCGLILTIFGFTAIGGFTTSDALAADEIVLGEAISQTGKYAREGKFYVDAYTVAVEAVNRAGGVKVGGKTFPLVLKLYDDQSDPNLSVRLFTKLVTADKVNF